MEHGLGRASDAAETLHHAAHTARETGIGFLGPIIQSALACTLTTAEERRAALAEGEEIIRNGCVGHNQLRFFPDAMQVALELSDWDEVDRYALALESFSQAEHLPWSAFYIGRGRVLAAVGRGQHGPEIVTAISKLMEEGERLEYIVALTELRIGLKKAAA